MLNNHQSLSSIRDDLLNSHFSDFKTGVEFSKFALSVHNAYADLRNLNGATTVEDFDKVVMTILHNHGRDDIMHLVYDKTYIIVIGRDEKVNVRKQGVWETGHFDSVRPDVKAMEDINKMRTVHVGDVGSNSKRQHRDEKLLSTYNARITSNQCYYLRRNAPIDWIREYVESYTRIYNERYGTTFDKHLIKRCRW
jgi:hypothetical protein